MKRPAREKNAKFDSNFEWASWTPRSHGKDAGSFKRLSSNRKPRVSRTRKAKTPSPTCTEDTVSVQEHVEEEVDLFANEHLGLNIDEFTFDSILGLGEMPATTQLVVSEPPSPGTLAAFPCLAPSPTVPRNEGVQKPVLKTTEGGFNIVWKAPRVLGSEVSRLSAVESRYKYFEMFTTPLNRFGAINRMINAPQKPVVTHRAVKQAQVAKPIGMVFNSQLVRAF